MFDKKVFQDRLCELMDIGNTSQSALAKAVGVQQQTISQYLQGKTIPNIDTFVKIAAYLKVPYGFLLGEVGNEDTSNAGEKILKQRVAKAIRQAVDQYINEVLNLTEEGAKIGNQHNHRLHAHQKAAPVPRIGGE